ncbi:MAG: DUF2784 domain-containing protein [Pseudomonadota bacterium]
MTHTIVADIVVVIHLLFIVFVVAGGLLIFRRRWMLFLHLPAALWGALIEFSGWICPLTPLEQQLRRAASTSPYQGSFVEHYILPIIYPSGLTRELQIFFGITVICINLVIYGCFLRRAFMAEKKIPS